MKVLRRNILFLRKPAYFCGKLRIVSHLAMHKESIRLILLTDFTEAFAYSLLKGILVYSKSHTPWVVCRMPPAYKEQRGIKGVLKWALKWKADAIIGQFDDSDPVELFKQAGIVVLAQDYQSRFASIPNISSEYRLTGRMAADFFLQKGFRNFAFYGYKNTVWSQERCEGFHERLLEQPFPITFSDYQKKSLKNLWSYESESLLDWVRSLPKPTALLACDDNQGNRISEICKINDIRIPEDIAVMSIDNDEIVCNLSDPPLTSIELDIAQGGFEAARLIDQMLHNRHQKNEDVIIRPVGIVERQSTASYATDDPHILTALRYIHEHLSGRITVDDIVRQVPLSRRLLEIRFRKATGQSIAKYVFNQRMQRFSHLLLTTDAPITSVAAEVGLTNYSNISRQFGKLNRGTPLEYRKQNRMRIETPNPPTSLDQ